MNSISPAQGTLRDFCPGIDIPDGYLVGKDTPNRRPDATDEFAREHAVTTDGKPYTFENKWFSNCERVIINGKKYVRIWRMCADKQGTFMSRRCRWLPGWEECVQSSTAYHIWRYCVSRNVRPRPEWHEHPRTTETATEPGMISDYKGIQMYAAKRARAR